MKAAILGPDDFRDAVSLARACGWNDILGDWHALASSATIFGIRSDQGPLLATAARCDFGPVVTIAKMLVHPNCRGRGFARQLMNACLELPRATTAVVSLIATPLGFPLYARSGFRTVATWRILEGAMRRGIDARLKPASSIEAIVQRDAEVWGCDRRGTVLARFAQAEHTVELTAGGRLTGYGWITCTAGGRYLAPVVADTLEDALSVIQALAPRDGSRFRIDVEDGGPLQRALVEAGLEPGEERHEMTLDGVPLPGALRHRFAPLALAYG